MNTQGLLFSEPSIAETGVWCRLNEDIDPAEWAKLCRHIGQMDAADFNELKMVLMGFEDRRATLWDKLKSVFTGKIDNSAAAPLVSIGPGKPGAPGQWEI